MDSFYTPARLAAAMVHHIRGQDISIVADFTCGDGELLRAAELRWPRARLIGADINGTLVRRLRRRHPGWALTNCDFLGRRLSNNPTLASAMGKVSVILLNPPFSNRGARRFSIRCLGKGLQSSQGMAFLCRSLDFLGPNGEVVAILPAGALVNQMDEDAWKQIRANFIVETIGEFHDRTFARCSPKTKLLRLKRAGDVLRNREGIDIKTISPDSSDLNVIIGRGKIDITTLAEESRNGVHLVHTTELKNGRVCFARRFTNKRDAMITGPSVLLPRVGRPNHGKISVLRSGVSVALTNCVLWIGCITDHDANLLQERILINWSVFSHIYGGTCASFATLARLQAGLAAIGVAATICTRPGKPDAANAGRRSEAGWRDVRTGSVLDFPKNVTEDSLPVNAMDADGAAAEGVMA